MSQTTEDPVAQGDTGFLRRFPRLGILAWSFIGAVIALGIIMSALGAVSEIILPLTFAAVLAIIFRPTAVSLGQKVGASAGAGLIVLGLLLMMAFVIVATVKGVTEQMDEIGESATSAIQTVAEQTEEIEVDEAALEDARAAVNDASPTVESGVLGEPAHGYARVVDEYVELPEFRGRVRDHFYYVRLNGHVAFERKRLHPGALRYLFGRDHAALQVPRAYDDVRSCFRECESHLLPYPRVPSRDYGRPAREIEKLFYVHRLPPVMLAMTGLFF
jgi:hypothetical protein